MWKLLNLGLSVLYRVSSLNYGFVFIGHFQQIQNVFTRRGRLSRYVGVSFYLFFLHILNKDTLLLLTSGFIYMIYMVFLGLFYFWWVKLLSLYASGPQTVEKPVHNYPLRESLKKSKFLKTLFFLCLPVINFKWIILFLIIR